MNDTVKPADTLEVTTPSAREIRMTRIFDAPRHLVFDALTTPELLRRWYGPRGWSLKVCDIDLRVGGTFRFVSSRPGGKEIGQYGVYQEVVRPDRLVNTESWEDWNPGETLVTTTLSERDGKTTFTCTMVFPSQAVRDQLIKSGMTNGAAETYDRLAECLTPIA